MNPRAAINDLLTFQASPFTSLGMSPCQGIELYAELSSIEPSARNLVIGGTGGIRTHAPFRTNGFQDRLVMTTSIPLRIY